MLPFTHRDTCAVTSSAAIRRTPLHDATVAAVRDLTPRMRRLTLHVPTLAEPRPAQDIELVLVDATGRRVKRRYTIRHFRVRPSGAEIDVDALLHGHADGHRVAAGAGWAATAEPGDPIQFFGPRGRLELRPADWHLFAGDESALPAFAALIEALPPHEKAIALIEVGDGSDEVPLEADVRWQHRGDVLPGGPGILGAAIDAFAPPPGRGRGYLLGESRAVSALRARLHARGLANEDLYVKGYWNLGRPGRA
jgi:NADPH-dependent ferric siderophore reductase